MGAGSWGVLCSTPPYHTACQRQELAQCLLSFSAKLTWNFDELVLAALPPQVQRN
eukprot:m.3003 g.3003  ORF g.3003 m.3003 type:complete len:55 (+) comp2005_c0_seq1:128-292(+)